MADNKSDETRANLNMQGVGNSSRQAAWYGQVSNQLANFAELHGLSYSEEVEPCIIQGQRCLLLGRHVSQGEPELLAYLLEFAQEHELIVQRERRSLDLPTSVERRIH